MAKGIKEIRRERDDILKKKDLHKVVPKERKKLIKRLKEIDSLLEVVDACEPLGGARYAEQQYQQVDEEVKRLQAEYKTWRSFHPDIVLKKRGGGNHEAWRR